MDKLLASQSQSEAQCTTNLKNNMINNNVQHQPPVKKIKVTIAPDHFYDYVHVQDGYNDYYNAISLWILHVGNHTIEVATPQYENLANQWAAKTLHDLRYLQRRGTPQVVSLCTFKGTPMPYFWARNNRRIDPHQSNPYRAISICLGGSHVLFHRQDYDYWWDSEFPVTPLKNFLRDNKKVVVIGLGIKDIAKKLKDHWQLQIAHTVELRKLVASAYKKELAKHEEEGLGLELELEAMAELVLDGMRVEKKPARVLQADWGITEQGYDYESELIKYASRDAFLSYQIATKCIHKAGGLPSHILD